MAKHRVMVLLVVLGAIAAMGPDGCNEQGGREPVTASSPQASQPLAAVARTQPAPATRPVEPPATQPQATVPKSTYSSDPPYPVSLYVTDPAEQQPGWLRIEGLIDSKQLGTATGRFPEQNRIYVETNNNVSRIRIHVTHLPLRPNERVILQIDKQGMVISRSRPFTTLERLSTGEWVVLKDK